MSDFGLRIERDELYDLEDDPQEVHNRIDDPAVAEVLLQMKERLLTFYLETADVVPHQKDKRNFDRSIAPPVR